MKLHFAVMLSILILGLASVILISHAAEPTGEKEPALAPGTTSR